MREKTEKLGTDPVWPSLLKLALPSTAGLLVGDLYVIVDRIFVGRYVGGEGLAAMSAVMPISMLIFGVSILIGRGTQVLYSLALGEKNYEHAQKYFGLSIALMLTASVFMTVFGLMFLNPLLCFFGVPDAAMGAGRSYLSVSLFGIVFVMFGFENNLIRAEGYSGRAMGTQLIGAAANIVLDYFFVARWNFGMAGAAWATVIAQGLSAAWVMSFFCSRKSIAKMRWNTFRFYGLRDIGSVLYNGCSPFTIGIAGSVIWTAQNHMLLTYGGDLAFAAFGVILTINQFLFAFLFGICMGMQPLIGYNTGAKKYDRVLAVFRNSVILGYGALLVPYCMVLLFPEFIMRCFVGDGAANAELVKLGAHSMRLYLLLAPVGWCSVLVSQYFQAVRQPMISLSIALCRQLVFQLPLVFLLPRILEYNGVLLSGPIGDTIGVGVAIFFMTIELRRLRAKVRLENSAVTV